MIKIERKTKQRTGMLWLWLILALIVGAVIILLPDGSTAKKDAGEDIAATTLVAEGVEAPDFTVDMTDGTSVTLSEQRGKVVLLTFWATWCPPCREELSHVQSRIIDRFAGREFVFLPISRGEQREDVVKFLSEQGYTFAAGLDPEQRVYGLYASNYIPRNFLIDSRGRVAALTVGYDDEEFAQLADRIENLLKQQ